MVKAMAARVPRGAAPARAKTSVLEEEEEEEEEQAELERDSGSEDGGG